MVRSCREDSKEKVSLSHTLQITSLSFMYFHDFSFFNSSGSEYDSSHLLLKAYTSLLHLHCCLGGYLQT